MRRRGRLPAALWLVVVTLAALVARPACAAWCIARSEASDKALQSALDYACGPARGADCAPIQASGLCYLPNTLAAHASYAFNSIFQRSRAAPGACDFAGTATVTVTDPSQLWIMHLPFISKHCRANRITWFNVHARDSHVLVAKRHREHWRIKST
ncbi:Glucan endo-1,3-beta-glucosidase 1 [Zea mays]|uniref:Glucan endo-1,3-beta-glucosidase 1 n=1 Tax=Zea mays TaxID=4577 RepID=A0A3L6FD76_MAIZE|nr:glucan endo-1,3-beta-glucosidase 4 isoform X1 [Zea mays]PWZ29567.1 Glucan endo-1,3-beta-glucosidase 1 [Zea mays]